AQPAPGVLRLLRLALRRARPLAARASAAPLSGPASSRCDAVGARQRAKRRQSPGRGRIPRAAPGVRAPLRLGMGAQAGAGARKPAAPGGRDSASLQAVASQADL